MSSAWNWIGIVIWLVVIAYFFWMVDNIHSRKKKMLKTALSNRRHALTSAIAMRNFEITALEIVVFAVLLMGIHHATFHHHVTNQNSIVTSQVAPLDYTHTKANVKHPTQKLHYYYVKIDRSRARNLKQKYGFRINGQNMWASNANAIVTTNPMSLKRDPNLPDRISKTLSRKLKQANHHRAWAIRVVTVYKNSLANGLGLHAGQKKFYYTILSVPKHSGIYLNQKGLIKKNHRKAVK